MTAESKDSGNSIVYTPLELKTLFEAFQLAPSWLSKRFIMQELCGWDEASVKKNVELMTEENIQVTKGNKIGGYR